MRKFDFDLILSTGAGIGISGPLLSLIFRKPFYFFESLARVSSLSKTGKIIEKMGFPKIVVRHASLASKNRLLLSSPFESYYASSSSPRIEATGLRIFVTLGTIRPYRFDRLIKLVVNELRPQDKVIWQLGSTSIQNENLPGKVKYFMTPSEFALSLAESDLVITHGGVGTILECLKAGKKPIVLARNSSYSEHVDMHQKDMVDLLHTLGLVFDADYIFSRELFFEITRQKIFTKRESSC